MAVPDLTTLVWVPITRAMGTAAAIDWNRQDKESITITIIGTVPKLLMGSSWENLDLQSSKVWCGGDCKKYPHISLLSISMCFAKSFAVHFMERSTLLSTPWIHVSLVTCVGQYKMTIWQCWSSKPRPQDACVLFCSLSYAHAFLDTSLLLWEHAWLPPSITRDHVEQS